MARPKPKTTRSSARRDYSAPALEKGMDIIELLAEAGAGLTVSEISQQLERPMSELFRVIVVMERRGWLQKDPDSARYSVAYHVLQLAHRGTPSQILTLAAAPVMHELSARINQTCHLVVLSGTHGLVVVRQENPRRHANLSVRLGATLSLARSCSGHILLAYLEPAQQKELLRSLPQPLGIARARLLEALTQIRRRGFEIQRSPITAGVTDIGYPVHGFDGKVVAALTIPYLHVLDNSLPATVDQTRRALADAARRISRALGWIH
jgi:DNA-binding IclR family transcriptional regulator